MAKLGFGILLFGLLVNTFGIWVASWLIDGFWAVPVGLMFGWVIGAISGAIAGVLGARVLTR